MLKSQQVIYIRSVQCMLQDIRFEIRWPMQFLLITGRDIYSCFVIILSKLFVYNISTSDKDADNLKTKWNVYKYQHSICATYPADIKFEIRRRMRLFLITEWNSLFLLCYILLKIVVYDSRIYILKRATITGDIL